MSIFHQGTVGTSRLIWYNPCKYWSTQSAILGQRDQNATGYPRVGQSQNWFEPLQKNIFQAFTSNPSYSEIFINFDQV